MKRTPATSLPWCTMPAQHGGKYIRGFDCTDVARVGLDINHAPRCIDANAAYIVHAANAYPELVAALQRCAGEDANGWAAVELLRKLGEL